MEKEPIKVWRFEGAPEEYKKLSEHGGDEDWVALIPPHYTAEYIGWMDPGGSFGYCKIYEYQLENGFVVRIGAHA